MRAKNGMIYVKIDLLMQVKLYSQKVAKIEKSCLRQWYAIFFIIQYVV